MTTRTRVFLIACLATVLCAVPRPSHAQMASSAPDIVAEGFDAYVKSDLRAALDVWLRGSPASTPATIEQLVATITPIEAAYGHVKGYDVMRVVQVGSAVRRVYVVIRYERGPMYAWFECYKADGGRWIIPSFLTNSRASEILPADLR